MNRMVLMYLNSNMIKHYIALHPIDWMEDYKTYARIGGYGDQAQKTPTPAVHEFLACLAEKRQLFTQTDYFAWCTMQWRAWYDGLLKKMIVRPDGTTFLPALSYRQNLQIGIKAKIFRNFYPSMIDSLHVWAMMAETGNFQCCFLDSYEDAIAKTDLTVVDWNGRKIQLALLSGSKTASNSLSYKQQYREGYTDIHCFRIPLDMQRARNPGNKRWYELRDFQACLDPASRN